VTLGSGVSLYYEEYGAGPPILFVHGYCMSGALWMYQMAELGAVARVIAPDLRGHGQSDKPSGPYNRDVFADDLRGFVEALGLEDFTLVAWSLGARVAVRYMLRHAGHGVARLALVGGVAVWERGGRPPPNWYQRRENWPSFAYDFAHRIYYRADPELIDWTYRVITQTPLPVALAVGEETRTLDPPETIEALNVPLLLVAGRHDHLVPVERFQRLAELLPLARLSIFEESGHTPFIEEHRDFNALLAQFCDFPDRPEAPEPA